MDARRRQIPVIERVLCLDEATRGFTRDPGESMMRLVEVEVLDSRFFSILLHSLGESPGRERPFGSSGFPASIVPDPQWPLSLPKILLAHIFIDLETSG
jgi:hypothetical protein